MKLVLSTLMRDLERRTIAEFDVSGEILMDRAGFGVAEVVQYLARVSGYSPDAPVRLVAGRGNNGGDAFVAAYYLRQWGFDVEAWLVGDARSVKGDALTHLARMREAGVGLRELSTPDDWDDVSYSCRCDGGVIVDGVLGTGIKGPARGTAAAAIREINLLSERNLVVAIDVPSGLNADNGEALGGAVMADVTVTMGLPKVGLVQPRALEYVGAIEVIDIGLPPELTSRVVSDMELITLEDLRSLRRRRPRSAHKGTFGHVLVVGGAPGYSGAVALAAEAATRSGVGLVTVLAPEGVAQIVAGIVPEAMVHPASSTADGRLNPDCLRAWGRNLHDFDAVVAGPGMTQYEGARRIVGELLQSSRGPVILDADALNACAGRVDIIKGAKVPVILTPHPGELARLMGHVTAEDVQADRFRWVCRLANDSMATAVLKGAGTLVAQGSRPLAINLTGNPGMATGGAGDVLAGLMAGIAAQGVPAFDAACVAVHLHGRAGDNVAWRGSQAGLVASDLIAELPNIFRELDAR